MQNDYMSLNVCLVRTERSSGSQHLSCAGSRRGFDSQESIPRFSPWVPGLCACVLGVCACGGVRPRYGAFRDYSDNLVYVESGQRGRPEILYDSLVLPGAFKKKSGANVYVLDYLGMQKLFSSQKKSTVIVASNVRTHASYRMFGHMHRTLNVIKKYN